MHTNKSLPLVGIEVLIVLPDRSTIPIKRDAWITNKDDKLELYDQNTGKILSIHREDIEWSYI